jgi:GT2 family glycosyltransferase
MTSGKRMAGVFKDGSANGQQRGSHRMSLAPVRPGGEEQGRAPGEARDERALSVSVVICAYASARWAALMDAVDSVRSQAPPPEQTIVVIDHNPALLERARQTFADVLVVPNAGRRGLSGARNTGVGFARGDVVAFLDDDARAHAGWLSELLAVYRDPDVVGSGGLVEPRWRGGGPPRWLPEEFYWTIGCSYLGLAGPGSPIRNPIGANMSLRRDAIIRAGGFREGVGRVVAVPLGCEETELSVRIARAHPETKIVHVTTARVDHLVEADRVRWRYFFARCWAEGRSKAIVTRHVGPSAGLASERAYVTRTLPRGVLTHMRAGVVGDRSGFARAAAIVAGLCVTVAGYLSGRALRVRAAGLEVQA